MDTTYFLWNCQVSSLEDEGRTRDLTVISRVLCQLSYLELNKMDSLFSQNKKFKWIAVSILIGRQGRTRTFKTPKGNGVTVRDATNYVLPADIELPIPFLITMADTLY